MVGGVSILQYSHSTRRKKGGVVFAKHVSIFWAFAARLANNENIPTNERTTKRVAATAPAEKQPPTTKELWESAWLGELVRGHFVNSA